MKVLYLANSLDTKSGWGRFSKEVITRVIKSGDEVKILTEINSGFNGEVTILKRSWSAIYAAFKVRRYIKDNNIDIIHSLELNPYAITAYFASLGLGIKHIITATGAYSVRPLHQLLTRWLVKRVYTRAHSVLCISKYIEDEIKKEVLLKNSSVIPLGINHEKFSGDRRVPLEPFIFSVGNLSYRKGYHVSVAAFAQVAKKNPSIKYYIAGAIDKNIYADCQKIITDNNIKDRVIFLGSIDDKQLKEFYLSAELFILTSVNHDFHFEGFGLVFLEAASAGLPVIGTRGNGISAAMSEGNNGLLVEQNNIEQTSQAILKILEDSNLKESFSKASIEWSKKNSWDNVVKKYLEIYKNAKNK